MRNTATLGAVDPGVYYLVATWAVTIMTLATIYLVVHRIGRAIDEFGARVNASIDRFSPSVRSLRRDRH